MRRCHNPRWHFAPKNNFQRSVFILFDIPGAFAQIAAILAETQVDLLSASSRTLKRGESAEWIVVADTSKCECSLEDLQERILSEKAAKKVSFRDLTTR